jgi:adenylyltransferase/sulfurtransferase
LARRGRRSCWPAACWSSAPAASARRCCSTWRRRASARSASSTTTSSSCPTCSGAGALLRGYDLIADGTDNFTTRYLINDLAFAQGMTLVSAALLRFDGQLSTFKAHLGPPHPCYRCLYPENPGEDFIPRCEQAGILGAVAGVMGTLQAAEVLKELLGLGESLSGRLLVYDALATSFRTVRFKRDPDCATCGAARAVAAQ